MLSSFSCVLDHLSQFETLEFGFTKLSESKGRADVFFTFCSECILPVPITFLGASFWQIPIFTIGSKPG